MLQTHLRSRKKPTQDIGLVTAECSWSLRNSKICVYTHIWVDGVIASSLCNKQGRQSSVGGPFHYWHWFEYYSRLISPHEICLVRVCKMKAPAWASHHHTYFVLLFWYSGKEPARSQASLQSRLCTSHVDHQLLYSIKYVYLERLAALLPYLPAVNSKWWAQAGRSIWWILYQSQQNIYACCLRGPQQCW